MAAVDEILNMRHGVRSGPEVRTDPGAVIAGRGEQRFRPIRDYALIGDCHGAALVCRDGSIDWCCLNRFDAEAVLGRLLEAERGGYFQLVPRGGAKSRRSYLGETAILATEFEHAAGRAMLLDFMPVGRRPDSRLRDPIRLNAPGWVVRIAVGLSGRVPFEMTYRPQRGLAAKVTVKLRHAGAAVAGEDVPALHASVPLAVEGDAATSAFELAAGSRAAFLLTRAPLADCDALAMADRLLAATDAFWREWIAGCRYDGAYAAMVRRSAITLKLLTYAPTGAIIAAPTTSLPERVGGPRNFDYRFCWLRDSAYTLYAFMMLGFDAEARAYVAFLRERHLARNGVHLMFGIGGETELEESDLDVLTGYRDSRPVRVGNAAYRQRQLDIYGETLDLALLHRKLGGRFDADEWRALAYLADEAARLWREPDNGIWEVRSGRRHFVYSKLMCWVAVDRACRLFGERPNWAEARAAIRRAVLEEGVHDGHFVGAFEHRGMDIAVLRVSWLGFPVDREIARRTVAAAFDELREGDYFRRYRMDDGMGGEEGAFLMGSFWMADALLAIDRFDEARSLFEAMLSKSNDVGLFSEEIDPASEAFLGNFPQGFVHLALITSALHLDLYRRRGPAAISGSIADRAGCGHSRMGRLLDRLRLASDGFTTRSILTLH